MAKVFWVDDKGPIAIAHRGGDAAGRGKENTLDAYRAAYDMGYRYAEADVILAASGELVVTHGSHNWLHASISRGISSQVLQMMTLDQIRYLVRPVDSRVPLLEEVLTAFPKMKFVLDLKTDEVIEPLAGLLRKLKATDRVCTSGYSHNRAINFVDACKPSTVSAGLTVGRGVRFRNMNMLLLKTGRLRDIEAVFIHHSLVSAPMINLIHRRGLKAVVWTVNSSLGIRHAVRSGADGIISDRIDLLKRILEPKTPAH